MQLPLTFWQTRSTALDTKLASFDQWLSSAPGLTLPRQPTLDCFVRSLRAFAAHQFNYAYMGFTQGKLDPSPDYPPECFYAAILDQVGFDLGVIQQAAAQRQSSLSDPAALGTLTIADKLADLALKFITGPSGFTFEGGQQPVALTYFQKSSSIRVIPYIPVALVGIPYASPSSPLDWVNIPHEVGHYVYRHAMLNGGRLLWRELDELVEDSVKHWLDEIFADVYSCLVGGPLVGLTGQAMQKQVSNKQFQQDDGEHPVPIWRPYIYHKVFHYLGLAAPLAVMQQNWRALWQARLGSKYLPAGIDQVISPGPYLLGKPVDNAIEIILKYYLAVAAPALNWADVWKTYAVNTGALTPEYLGEELYTYVGGLNISTPALTLKPDEVPEASCQWSKSVSLPASGSLKPEVWLPVLKADGWTTKGANGEPKFH